MIEISSDEIKRYVLEILVDFDRVCSMYNLRYSLAYGTLLGAVRHRGFIPWDDDVDVIMPRKDYSCFSEIAEKELRACHKLVSINEDSRFGNPLPKIIDTSTVLNQKGHISEKINLGVYMDIFIMDKIPANRVKKFILYKKCKFYQKMWSFFGCYADNHWAINNIRKIANKTSLANCFALRLMNINNEAPENDTNNLCSALVYTPYGYKVDEMDLREFDDLIYVDFEGHKFKSIRKYDEYLKRHYGDYMIPPPIDKRVSGHNFSCFKYS